MNTIKEPPSTKNIFFATLLVAGTCIGGGMLAIPISTGLNGFLPAFVLMFVAWFMMTTTALFFSEASLWMEEGAHIMSMTSRILGPIGKAVSFILYMFIAYASLVAYTSGGALEIAATVRSFFELEMSKSFSSILFVGLFGSVIYLGAHVLDRINMMLVMGMAVAYGLLVFSGMADVKLSYLERMDFQGIWKSAPILLTAFSFQAMVPNLTPYLNKDVKSLRIAIIGGTTLAFAIYAVWELIVLGIVPLGGEDGLQNLLESGNAPIQFLKAHVQAPWTYIVAEFFVFFAITTSFIGIGWGLYDFLADALKIKKEKKGGALALGLLIAVPTLFFSIQFDKVFLLALDLTGGFGDTILNGVIPVLLIWIGRYVKEYHGKSVFPCGKQLGKPFLVFIFFLYLLVFVSECISYL